MNIEIKKSVKPVNYIYALRFMEERLEQIFKNNGKELIWTLEHEGIYTGGTSYSKNDIIDKSINIIETNRGGKITWHGPGQLICYFVLDLRSKKDVRKFINKIEKTIIETLEIFDIQTFADKENIGIWHNENGRINKVAAIGVRVKKWIAYHGFAININNNLNQYKKIVPCGIKDKGITNLVKIKKKDYSKLNDLLIEKFISNLKN
tara:strand:- start:547 stop:1164 length:618 start_codon:yes stop_codon:yes gene_type:complete